MLSKSNIVKALILSVCAGIILIAFQIITASRIHSYSPDLDWDVVNSMPYKDALEYLKGYSITRTGFSVFIEHIKNPIYWPHVLIGLFYKALSFFISYLALLLWIQIPTQPNKVSLPTPKSGAAEL